MKDCRKTLGRKFRWGSQWSPTKGDRPANGEPSAPHKQGRYTNDTSDYVCECGYCEYGVVRCHQGSANNGERILRTIGLLLSRCPGGASNQQFSCTSDMEAVTSGARVTET